MTGVRWSPKSRADMQSQYNDIAKPDSDAAVRVVETIEQRGNWLCELPFGGAAIDRTDFRASTVAALTYIIIYRLRSRSVSIVYLHHQSQNRQPR